jgi:hypothetical protein
MRAIMSTSVPVYRLKFKMGMQDPDVDGERQHTTLFVATGANGSGDQFHVTGDVTSTGGMVYERKTDQDPRLAEDLHSIVEIGATAIDEHYPESWDAVLQAWTPPQQKAFNISTMRTEPFKTLVPLVFYEPAEQKKVLLKCTEWTEQFAIPSLEARGLLVPKEYFRS